MKITKFLHSCVLVEKNGRKLLIDPGDMSFFEKKIFPEDIGGVDVILFTHRHRDHFYPEALQSILCIKTAMVLTHEEIGKELQELKITYTPIAAGEEKTVEGFRVEALGASHGPGGKAPLPHNLGYRIDGTLLHPGDCVTLENVEAVVLALPAIGSWMRFPEAVVFAERVKPQYVIPIHDVLIKDAFLERVYDYYREPLENKGVSFRPLAFGEVLEV